jgi:hypothetical protein
LVWARDRKNNNKKSKKKTEHHCPILNAPRLRRGVRWQAERDTAFDAIALFELEVLPTFKAVPRPPHSKTLRRFGWAVETPGV